MQKQEQLFTTEKRFKTAFEKSQKENAELKTRIILQNKQIKNLKRKMKNQSFWERLKKLFKKNHQGRNANVPRPLKKKENQKLLIKMLEDGLTLSQIAKETGRKRDNITEFIRVHGLRSIVKEWK